MKIVYDNIVFSLQKSGGISVVWYELLKRMLSNRNIDLVFIEYQNANQNIFRNKLDLEFKKTKDLNDYFLFAIRYLNPCLKEIKEPFIFHSSYYRIASNKNAINVTTVHDFIYEKFRKGIKKEIHCFQKRQAILNSDLVICVSENTKKDLLKYYPKIDSQKVHVVYNGVSNDYFVNTESTFQSTYSSQKYMIYVGVRDEYKRFDIAVETAKQLDINLVIVGGGILSKNEINYINSKLTNNQYQFFRNLSNIELNNLYSNALCLIYPSSYEGFGIPVIEAQRSGCPVVAFNNGAVKEIIGNTPLIFNNFNVNEIVILIRMNLFDISRRNEIIKAGLLNSKKYSWDNTYKKINEIYNLLLK